MVFAFDHFINRYKRTSVNDVLREKNNIQFFFFWGGGRGGVEGGGGVKI